MGNAEGIYPVFQFFQKYTISAPTFALLSEVGGYFHIQIMTEYEVHLGSKLRRCKRALLILSIPGAQSRCGSPASSAAGTYSSPTPCASPHNQVTAHRDQGDCISYFPLESGPRPRALPWQTPCRRSIFGEPQPLIPLAPLTRWKCSPDAVPVASPSFGFSVCTKGNSDRIIFNC